jgi:membrane protease YdiL (CAAX protease family)
LIWSVVAIVLGVTLRFAIADAVRGSGIPVVPLLRGLSHLPWVPFVIYSLLLSPILEEYCWRGFIVQRAGIVPGSAMFGLAHTAALCAVLPPMHAWLISLPT